MMARTIAEMRMNPVVVKLLGSSTAEADVVGPVVTVVASVFVAPRVSATETEVMAAVAVSWAARRLSEMCETSEAEDSEAKDDRSEPSAFEAWARIDEVYAASGVGSGIVVMPGGPIEVVLFRPPRIVSATPSGGWSGTNVERTRRLLLW